MLDGIQDPRNLGAIIRSAYCTGAGAQALSSPKKIVLPLMQQPLRRRRDLQNIAIFIWPIEQAKPCKSWQRLGMLFI